MIFIIQKENIKTKDFLNFLKPKNMMTRSKKTVFLIKSISKNNKLLIGFVKEVTTPVFFEKQVFKYRQKCL